MRYSYRQYNHAPSAQQENPVGLLSDFCQARADLLRKQLALFVTQRAPLLQSLCTRLGYSVAREFHWPRASGPSCILAKALG